MVGQLATPRAGVLGTACCLLIASFPLEASRSAPLVPSDLYRLEIASQPRISPDGRLVAYLRNRRDAAKDQQFAQLWLVRTDGKEQHQLATNTSNAALPCWAADGKRLAYVDLDGGKIRLMALDVGSGHSSVVSELPGVPSSVAWAPDGRRLALSMYVADASTANPASAAVAPDGMPSPSRYTDRTNFRLDGQGPVDGSEQIFIVPGSGGPIRQLTTATAAVNMFASRVAWLPDSKTVLYARNEHHDWEKHQFDSEVFSVDVESGESRALTGRFGPDFDPAPSPNGRLIAYTGYDDKNLFATQNHLYVMSTNGSNQRLLLALDSDITRPVWRPDGKGLYFIYSARGEEKIGYVSLAGVFRAEAGGLGSTDTSAFATEPYVGFGADFDAAADTLVTVVSTANDPSQVAVLDKNRTWRAITDLNRGWLPERELGQVSEILFRSSFDQRDLQGWVVHPPNFEPSRQYPMILAVHGGPELAYGPRLSFRYQLWASAGYLVVYANYRGSTTYGQEFLSSTQFDFPDHEYEDLLSAVNTVVAQGIVDRTRTFIVGESAGGLLAAWAIGHTHMFRAAVLVKPVVNLTSFALNFDLSAAYLTRWFPSTPWDDPNWFWRHSPLSLVGDVDTPTLVVVSNQDERVGQAEGIQFYTALKLRGQEAGLLVLPESTHVVERPSQELAKSLATLDWFDRHGGR